MNVSEIFYSVSGEQPTLGQPAIFLRLSGCNLRCRFCDSSYALGSEYKEMTVAEVINEIENYLCKLVVITGGEPLLPSHQTELATVLEGLLALPNRRWKFQIETNGYFAPSKELVDLIDIWVISPKLSNSGNKPYELGDYPSEVYDKQVCFKFVVGEPRDFKEILDFLNGCELYHNCRKSKIYLMPMAITPEEHNEKLPMLFKFAKLWQFTISPRLQILGFGNKRGV